jgi:hypothetical protein
MGLACREYVTRQGCDTMSTTIARREAIGDVLDAWLKEKRIRGFEALSIRNQEDLIEYDLDEGSIYEVTAGAFPFLWVNVTFESGKFDTSTLAPLERDYGLRLLSEFHS